MKLKKYLNLYYRFQGKKPLKIGLNRKVSTSEKNKLPEQETTEYHYSNAE